jgi:hypothetical protein
MDLANPVELTFEPGTNEKSYNFDRISFDPSGKYLVSQDAVWDAWTGKRTFSAFAVGMCELFRDGKLLVRLGPYAGAAVQSYDLDSHETKHVVATGEVTSFCLSQDEKHLFALDRKTMRKVDLDSCCVLERWAMPRAVDDGPRLGRDVYCARAEGVAIPYSKGIMLLSAKNGALLWDRPLQSVAVALAPDGNHLACLVPEGKDAYQVHLVDVKSGTTVHTLAGAGQLVSRLAYAPGGKYLTVTSAVDKGGQIDLWNVAQRQLVRTVKYTPPPSPGGFPPGPCLSLSFSPDGQKLAAHAGGVTGGTVSVLDIGLALNLSADEVEALDVRKNPAPPRKIDKKPFEPRPRRPFGDDAATKLQFKDGKITGFLHVADNDPFDRNTKGPPVKLFLLPLEAGQTYRFEIAPNLGEKWEDNQYRMRIEDAEGKTVVSNLPPPGASTGPIPGRLTLTAAKAGTYRLVVLQNRWLQHGFTLSVSPVKD